ncbi:MAG TPA: hypothetical protein VJ873_01130, partial [bacterium]|nr:hypothetical protein [bacterium]
MKLARLLFILTLLFSTQGLFAKGYSCDSKEKPGDEKYRHRPSTPDYTIEGNTLKTLGFSFELKQAAEVLKDKDQEFYVYLYPSPDKKAG